MLLLCAESGNAYTTRRKYPMSSPLLDQSTVLSPFLVSLVPQIPTPSSRACFDYPAGRETWRPNSDLETRDTVRKRTPKDGRPLTKTKGIKPITAGTCRVRIEENEA
ncbi:uncharacterized protein LOC144339465 [Macaca mulatta]